MRVRQPKKRDPQNPRIARVKPDRRVAEAMLILYFTYAANGFVYLMEVVAVMLLVLTFDERLQIFNNDFPNQIVVYSKINMNETMAHPDNLLPW